MEGGGVVDSVCSRVTEGIFLVYLYYWIFFIMQRSPMGEWGGLWMKGTGEYLDYVRIIEG